MQKHAQYDRIQLQVQLGECTIYELVFFADVVAWWDTRRLRQISISERKSNSTLFGGAL